MKDRPILFSAPMVRAILEGRKSQTRRVMKDPEWYGCPTGDCPHQTQHECDQSMNDQSVLVRCPYGVAGDRLWVREAWYNDIPPHTLPKTKPGDFDPDALYFRADGECCQQIAECSCAEVGKPKWRPGMFLPRWASRLTLLIKAVRVEPLQEISEADAKAEGCEPIGVRVDPVDTAYRAGYARLWDSINGPGSWAANPWVWVIKFERIGTQEGSGS